jgi:hypothetical protein
MAKTNKSTTRKRKSAQPAPPLPPARRIRPCVQRVASGLSPALWKAIPRAGQKVILYTRLAREQGRGKGSALATQLATCRKWARAHGWQVAGSYQEVISGLAKDSPELQRAAARAQAEGVALVCLSWDRLSRHAALTLERLRDYRRQGIAFYFGFSGNCRDTAAYGGQNQPFAQKHLYMWECPRQLPKNQFSL